MSKFKRKALLAGNAGVVAAEWPIFVRYDVPVLSLQDAADSLLALEHLVYRIPLILDGLSPGMRKAYAIPLLNEITHQSPFLEGILVRLFFGSKRGLNKNLDEIRRKYKLKSLSDLHPLAPWIVIGGIVIGAGYLGGCLSDMFNSKKGAPEPLGFSQNTIINIGDTAVLSAGDIVGIIDAALPDKRKLAEDTVKLVRPTQGHANATLQIGMTNVPAQPMISKKALADIPVEMPPVDRQKSILSLTNQDMEVRAADYDSATKGWGVILTQFHSNRLPLQLDPSINPSALVGKTRLKGDVDVTLVFDSAAGQKTPSLVTLRALSSAQ